MRIPRFVCATGRTATADASGFATRGFLRLGSPIASTNKDQYRIISRCSADSPTNSSRSEGATDNEPERAPGRDATWEAGIQPRLAGPHQVPRRPPGPLRIRRYRCSGRANFRGHRTATRSSRGYADGVPRESAPLRLFQRHRWSCTHPTASAGSKLLERKSCHAAGIYDERGACESR